MKHKFLLCVDNEGYEASLEVRKLYEKIPKATHSLYSHMGIVFLRNGSPHVYEAIKTVQYTPLIKWVDRGEGGHYNDRTVADRTGIRNG